MAEPVESLTSIESEDTRLAREKSNAKRAALQAATFGVPGTQFLSGYVNSPNEYLAKWVDHTEYLPICEEMRRSDGTVAAVLAAIRLMICAAEWTVEPPEDATPEEENVTEFVQAALFERPRDPWKKTLGHMTTGIWAGFSVHELVYVYEGGKIWVHRFAPRLASTIDRFIWNTERDELEALEQRGATGPNGETPSAMPREKVLLYSHEPEGDDPRGQTILRRAYKHWFLASNIEKMEAVKHERHAVGIPTVELPENPSGDAYAAAEKICKSVRAHQQSYAVLPFGYKLSMLDQKADKTSDTDPAIRRHKEEIARSALADFVMLGTTKSGSRALGENKTDFFLLAIDGTCAALAEAVEEDVVRRLVDWNFGPKVRKPVVSWTSPFDRMDPAAQSEAMERFIRAGVLTADEEMERYIRDGMGLPAMQSGEEKRDRRMVLPTSRGAAPKKEDAPPPTDLGGGIRGAVALSSKNPVREWRRPLTRHEEFVSLREIDGRIDDGIDGAVAKTRALRDAMVDELATEAEAAVKSGDPKQVLSIEVDPATKEGLAKQINATLLDLHTYGRRTVRDELERHGVERKVVLETPVDPVTGQIALIAAISAQMAEEVVNRANGSAREMAEAAFRTGAVVVIAREVLRERIEKSVRQVVAKGASNALNLGRRDEQQAAKEREEVERVIYSSVLDENTCDPCASADGTLTVIGSSQFDALQPPLRECEGGGYCRCIWVVVGKEDVETAGAAA